jgi:amino acid transporter
MTSTATHEAGAPRTGWWHGRTVLLLAFAFSVMADPVSSVAYAIEAALRALDGRLTLLLPAMFVVILIVGLVVASYHQLVARFPEGGGAAAATGKAFGEGLAFVPMGALVVDFVLTIAISVSAGSSAIISYVPSLSPYRLWLALGLLTIVAGLMRFGHLGRAVFALLTIAFVVTAVVVLITSGGHDSITTVIEPSLTSSAPLTVALAFPVAMALATGVEAPSSAIAQLAQLDDAGRRSFGRWALWLTLGIVSVLTMGLAAVAVHLGIGVPGEDTTLVAELARAGSSHAVFSMFQGTTALLLLSAASSSFQAGPGLLKALARSKGNGPSRHGVLPSVLGTTNVHHVPVVGVAVFYGASVLVVIAAGARDQRLVLFYAVAVFVSFLMGLLAMATFAWRERRVGWVVLNAVAATAVGFTLVANALRPAALGSLAATAIVGGGLYFAWVKEGRPRGASHAVAEAETDADAAEDAGSDAPEHGALAR